MITRRNISYLTWREIAGIEGWMNLKQRMADLFGMQVQRCELAQTVAFEIGLNMRTHTYLRSSLNGQDSQIGKLIIRHIGRFSAPNSEFDGKMRLTLPT